MKTPLLLVASLVTASAFLVGCASSDHHGSMKTPTGAPKEHPMKSSGGSTGGSGGPR